MCLLSWCPSVIICSAASPVCRQRLTGVDQSHLTVEGQTDARAKTRVFAGCASGQVNKHLSRCQGPPHKSAAKVGVADEGNQEPQNTKVTDKLGVHWFRDTTSAPAGSRQLTF